MSFNFGATPTFGTQAATTKPNPVFSTSTFGFGNQSTAPTPSFGLGTATTTASTGFGTFGSTFGAQATTQSTGFGFGTTPSLTASTASGGFGGFGTTPSLTTPAASTGFGGFGATTLTSTATSAAPSTGFGGFGATTLTSTATSAAPSTGFGGFGTGLSTTTPAASTGTGFGGFGTTPSLATTTTPATGFTGFGTTPFGQTTTTTSSLFSGFGQTQTTQAGFGGFGAKPLGGFGTTTPTLGSTGLGSGLVTQGITNQPQMQTQSEIEQVVSSVLNCCLYGDERDAIVSRMNLIQASWGKGKGYYSQNGPPVEYTAQNPFFRFKAVVYSVRPTVEPKDGFVALQFNKTEEEIRNNDQQLGQGLANIFNLSQRLNLTLHVDTIRPISETSTLVFIFMEEKANNGQIKRIANTELSGFLLQPTQINQLKQMGVTDCYPFQSPDKDQIQEYLDNPPPGIDPLIWKQAQMGNPDPKRLIPMPLYGFSQLRWRYQCQVEETKRHTVFLDKLAEDIARIKSENESARLKIQEAKQKVSELEHRILKVMARQQITSNIGVALRPEEEMLRSILDTIHTQLQSPQFSGRLSELLTQVRLHKQEVSQQTSESYTMTPAMKEEVKGFLIMQQDAIKAVIAIMKSDGADLKLIEEDLIKMRSKKEIRS